MYYMKWKPQNQAVWYTLLKTKFPFLSPPLLVFRLFMVLCLTLPATRDYVVVLWSHTWEILLSFAFEQIWGWEHHKPLFEQILGYQARFQSRMFFNRFAAGELSLKVDILTSSTAALVYLIQVFQFNSYLFPATNQFLGVSFFLWL